MDPDLREINQTVPGDLSCDKSRNSAHLQTVIEMGENEISDPNAGSNGSTLRKPVFVDDAAKIEDKSTSYVIDVNSRDSTGENYRICRICHLSPKESGKTSMDLIELGCECKDASCLESWSRVKLGQARMRTWKFSPHQGLRAVFSRLCEICGKTAKNIKGVGNNEFLEEWNDHRSSDAGNNSSDNNRRCLRRQPLCNFLMACLVIAFILPWFFRVNMF